MRLARIFAIGRPLRSAALVALALAPPSPVRAAAIEARSLGLALERGSEALSMGNSDGARRALREALARLERADAAHRARFERAAQVAPSGDAAQRREQAQAAYEAGQGRLLRLLRTVVAEGSAAHAMSALDEARGLHARIEAASAPAPISAGPRVRAPRLAAPALPAAASVLEPQGIEPPIGSVPIALRQAADALAGPIEVYEWVRNTIRPEFYHGRMKGPLETYLERSGNDVDTASVLVEMLRAKGVPARYVRGVAEMPAASIVAITGTSDATQALRVLSRAGIPHEPLAGSSGLTAVRMHRVWAEALLPYANYRGASVDQQGSVWLPLDAGFKAMTPPSGLDVAAMGFDARQTFDDYLEAPQTETPMAVVRGRVTGLLAASLPGATYSAALNHRTLVPQRLGLLPSTLPYKVASVAGVGYDVDEDLRHRLHVVGSDDDGVFLDVTIDVADALGRRVTIGYQPETEDDRRIAAVYGGMHLTPPYLLSVVPTLKVGGVPVGVASRGIGMAVRYDLRVALVVPGGQEEVVNRVQAGNLLALGLAGRQPTVPDEATAADQILARIAIGYLAKWNASDDELADLLRVVPLRATPSICLARSDIEVEYAGGDPLHPLTFDWKGILVDADLRAASPVGVDSTDAERRFLLLSGLEGSVLEDRVFADDLQIPAVSTAQVLGLAAGEGMIVHDVTRENVDAVLPTLPYGAEVKDEIRDAALSGMLVRVPAAPVTRLAWTGVGYVMLDEESGEAAWQLQGGHSGGVTAPAVIEIPPAIADPLIEQGETIEPAPEDAQVATVQRFVSTDFQEGTVGKPLPRALRVLATDAEGRAVRNARVVFTVLGGGGRLTARDQPTPETEVTVFSNERGEAEVSLQLGTRTDDIPRLLIPENPNLEPTQIGLNLVTARVASVGLTEPFTAFALPDDRFDGTTRYADLRWHGYYSQPNPNGAVSARIRMLAEDPYGNPISNFPITYRYRPPAIAIVPPEGLISARPANDSPSWLLSSKDFEICTLTHPVPLTGDCAGQVATLQVPTSWLGASAYVAVGTSPASLYFIDAVVGTEQVGWISIPTTGWACAANPTGHCSTAPTPLRVATGMRPFRANALGNIVEAYPLGGEASVLFWADEISEIERVERQFDEKGHEHFIAYGTNQWRRERLSDSQIALTPATPGTVPAASAPPLGGGRYAAAVRMANLPQLNTVKAEGTHYPHDLVFSDLAAGELDPAYVNPVTLQATRVRAYWGPEITNSEFSLWGVLARLHDLDPAPVRVGPQGTVAQPATVKADVEPAEYKALLTPSDVRFEIFRDGELEPVLVAHGTGGTFQVPVGMPYPPEPHSATLAVANVSTAPTGATADVVSEPYALPGCYLVDLQTPVVQIEMTIDAVNATSCSEEAVLRFKLCRAARVTLRVDGQVFTSVVDGDNAPVPIQDLPLAAGEHTVAVPPHVIAPGLMTSQTAQVPFQLRGVAEDDPSVVQESPGIIAGSAFNRSMLPVGHTFVKDVDLYDGHLVVARTDIALAGRHLGVTARRVFSTSGVDRDGLLGAGWSFSYEASAYAMSCGKVAVETPDGGKQLFTELPDGSYRPQRGYHGRLVRDTSAAAFDYFDKAGNRHHFTADGGSAGPSMVHRLRYIEEPHGDRIVLTYEGTRLTRVAEVHPESGEVRWISMRYGLKGGFERIVSIASSLGHAASYTYDAYGNLVRAERTAPGLSWSERFDYTIANARDRHQIVAVTDANGNRTTYTYYRDSDELPGWDADYSLGKTEYVRRVTEYPGTSGGVVTEFAYDLSQIHDARWLTVVRDALGNPTRYVMRGDGATLETHAPLGRSTIFGWAPDDVLKTSETDANGRVTRNAYDERGNLTRETVESADGTESETVATYAYEPRFNRLTSKDEGGRVTTHEIDPADGDVLSTTDPVGAVTRYDYDEHGRLVAESDHDDNVTTYSEHDSFGRARRISRPLGLEIDRTYDDRGRLVAEEDSFGHETQTDYDGFDRPVRVLRSALEPSSSDELTTTEYYPNGQVRRTTSASGAVTDTTLDGMGRVVRTAVSGPGLPSPLVTDVTYDGNGNRIGERDARGVERRTTFDALDQPTRQEILAGPGGGPTGVIARFTYDDAGNKTSETDLAGLVTRFAYDLRYRVKRKTLPENGPSGAYFEEYLYDTAGNLTQRRDANGHLRTFGYDGHNRRIAWQDESGHARRVAFDLASGRLDRPKEEADDTSGRRTTFEYDALHRETERRVHLEGPGGDGAVYLTSTAYPSGRVSVTTDPRMEETRVERDGLDRPTLVRVDPSGLDLTTRTAYDGLGKPTAVTDPRGEVTRHAYDAIGRLLETMDADEKVSTTAYDAGGLKTRVTDRRGVRRDFTYDNLGRPLAESVPAQVSEQPWSRETRYEDAARRRVEVDALGRTTTHELDGLGRVIRETDADGKFRLFTYDGVNKRSETDKRPEHHRITFAYDAFDRLVETIFPDLGGASGTMRSTTAYQDASNTRVDTDRRGIATTTRMDPLGRTREVARADALLERHTYDGNGNRLTSLDAEGRATAFEYDAANRLVRRTDGVGTPTESSVTYVPDANGNVLEERDARAAALSLPFSVQRTFDALNRLKTEKDGLLQTTEHGWDAEGNLVRRQTPNGGALLSTYDELAKLTRTTEPATDTPAAVTVHSYDANRNRTAQTDARGNTVEIHYDALGRLTAMVQPGPLTTAREYDANGNVLVLTDAKGQTVTSTYDEWNRVKTKSYAFAPGDPDRPWRWLSSIDYDYDANDNVTRVEETVAAPDAGPGPSVRMRGEDVQQCRAETVERP